MSTPHVDWALLRQQKQELVEYTMSGIPLSMAVADGLIHLLDAMQDAAVASRAATEFEVFGAPE